MLYLSRGFDIVCGRVYLVQLPSTINRVDIQASGSGTALVQVTLSDAFMMNTGLLVLPSVVLQSSV